jgi:uroporphyrinogen-III synthase
VSAPGRLRVLVTRPAEQAEAWVARLRIAGFDAEALPLIAIAPLSDQRGLHAAWAGLGARRLVVFVSSNAVVRFFAARPPDCAWPVGLVAAAPGPGTAEALSAAGIAEAAIVAPASDAPQFDSESLWARLQERDWRGASVLIVSGDGGRDWLAERLRAAGAEVEAVPAYRREAPVFTGAEAQRLAQALADDAVVWLFSSAEAIINLAHAAGNGRFGNARAIASHPRIAERARSVGFGRVVEAGPRFDAVVACIQSIGP